MASEQMKVINEVCQNYSDYHLYSKKLLDYYKSNNATIYDFEDIELIKDPFYSHSLLKLLVSHLSITPDGRGEYASIKQFLFSKYKIRDCFDEKKPNIFTDSVFNKLRETTEIFLMMAFNLLDGNILSFIFDLEKFVEWAKTVYGSCWKEILSFDVCALAEIADRLGLVSCYQQLCKYDFPYLQMEKSFESFDPIFGPCMHTKEQEKLAYAIENGDVATFDFSGKTPSILFSGDLFDQLLNQQSLYDDEEWYKLLKYIQDSLHLPPVILMLDKFKCFADPRVENSDCLKVRNYAVPFLDSYFKTPDPCYIKNILHWLEDVFSCENVYVQPLKDIYLKSKQTIYPECHLYAPESRRDFIRGFIMLFLNERIEGFKHKEELFENWLWPILKVIGTLNFDSEFENGFRNLLPRLLESYNIVDSDRINYDDEIFNYQEKLASNFAFIVVYAATRKNDTNAIDKVFQRFNFLINELAFPSNMAGNVHHLGKRILENRYELGRGDLLFAETIVEDFIRSRITTEKNFFLLDTRPMLPYYKYDASAHKDDMFNEDYDTFSLLYSTYQNLLNHIYFDILLDIKLYKYLPWWVIRLLTPKQRTKIYLDIAKPLRIAFAIDESKKTSRRVKLARLFMERFSPNYTHVIKKIKIDCITKTIYVNNIKTTLKCSPKQLDRLRLLLI